IKQAKVIIKENQTKDQGKKKFKKASEPPRDNMLNDIQTNIENLNKKLAELEKE
ncbi:15726_t:CDS:1, partial [Cetraspora pellucida]